MPRQKTKLTLIEAIPDHVGSDHERPPLGGFRQVPDSPDFESMGHARKWVAENVEGSVTYYGIRVIGSIKQTVETVKKCTVEPV
jgi:hypothetical protein